MKRQLLLVGGTLGGLVVVYLIYLAITGVGGKKAPPAPPAPPVEAMRTATARGVVEPQEGTDFFTTDRDQQGRLRRVFSAPAYKRTEEGVYVLTQPKAVIYETSGQQVQVTADEGTVYTKALRRDAGTVRLSVARGDLRGNVKLYLDRAPPPEGPPVEQRADDPNVMTVTADNVHFDNDRLLLYTNDQIHLTSQQMELSGRGLSLRWNEDPQELQILRLEHGDNLVVYEVSGQEEMGLLGLPTGGTVGEAPAVDLTATAPAGLTPAPVATVAEPPAREPTPPPRRQGKNIYQATFYGDVRVVQGDRYIRGARTLSMEFQWARQMGGRPAEPPQTQPASDESAAPRSRQGRGPASAPAGAGPVASAPAATQPTGPPVTITWSGPLEILPTGYTDQPSQRNVAVLGQGQAVTLFDGQTSAQCQEFEFRRVADPAGDRRLGRLVGTPTSPALLSLAGGEEILCPVMRFEMTDAGDTARLEGAGYLVRPTSGATELGFVPGRPSTEAAAGAPPVGGAEAGEADFECISWRDSVDALLVRDQSVQGGLYIRQARFRGEVDSSSGQDGDRLRCDDLLVTVERRPDAAGGVRTVIQSVTAQGHVVISGGSDQGRWQAFANRLDGSPEEGTGVLHGEPAWVTGRDSTLTGKDIYFQAFRDQEGKMVRGAGLARVDGAGELQMLMDRDLGGATLETPRPATITWQNEMRYVDYGRSGLGPQQGPELAPANAIFQGQVRLVSGDEEMTCGQMRATFAESTAPRTGSDRLNLGAVSYGGPLSKVFATHDVVLISHRRDDQQRVRGLVELRTDSMVYDALARTVDSQAGWLLVQDLRPPVPLDLTAVAAPGESGLLPGGDLESPSQTYFEWFKTMHLAMATRRVELSGNVSMRHASGGAIVERDVLQEKYGLDDWPGSLPSGRLTDLQCDKLLARFAPRTPTEPNAPAPADAQAGLNLVGPLDLFVATGAVHLVDDPWEMFGEKLGYARSEDLVTILGSADGSNKANARLIRKEVDRVLTNESPYIRWYRKNPARPEDRIETGPMTGAGVILPGGAANP